MSNFPQTLICLLVVVLARGASPARGQGDPFFIYEFNGGPPPRDLALQGDADFANDTTFLRLTKTDAYGEALPFSIGRAVHTLPVHFWEAGAQVDFKTLVRFIIRPNPSDADPGDGLAFFIAPVGHPIGFTGESFGIFDRNGENSSVFAVEFDIYPNPGVDPTYRHVGIDVGSNVSKNTTDAGDAFLGEEVTALIDYGQASKEILVRVSAGGKNFEVSYVFDLSSILPQQVQVGIAAATGGSAAVHELISWYFTSTVVEGGAGGIRQYA